MGEPVGSNTAVVPDFSPWSERPIPGHPDRTDLPPVLLPSDVQLEDVEMCVAAEFGQVDLVR